MNQQLSATHGPSIYLLILVSLAAFPLPVWAQHSQHIQPVSEAAIEKAIALNTKNLPDDFRPRLQTRERRYRIHRSDVLDVRFPFAPEFDHTATVQPDGYIMMSTGGDLKVEGNTMPEAVEAIENAYATILGSSGILVARERGSARRSGSRWR